MAKFLEFLSLFVFYTQLDKANTENKYNKTNLILKQIRLQPLRSLSKPFGVTCQF